MSGNQRRFLTLISLRSIAALILLAASGATPAQAELWASSAQAGFGAPYPNRCRLLEDVSGDGIPDVLVTAAGAHRGPFLFVGYVGVLSGADGTVVYEMFGSSMNEVLWSPGAIGDVDGDGAGDYLITSVALPLSIVSGASGAVISSLLWSTVAGGVGPVGDVNGDGFGDFAHGAVGGNFVEIRAGPTGNLLFNANGPVPGGYFGAEVAPAGDVDLDGVPDFLVGAPGPDFGGNPGNAGPGYAYICSGVDGSIIQQWTGPGLNSAFGRVVASPGDVDGDGVPDVLVGAPGYLNNQPFFSFSSVWLYSGSTGAQLSSFQTSAFIGYGVLGWAVSGAGDVDGDGTPDYAFLAGAYTIEVHSGATHALLYAVNSPSTQIRFGRKLAEAGDVNGDDFPDIIVGSPSLAACQPSCPGRVQMLSMAPQGLSTFGSGCALTRGDMPRIGGTAVPNVGQAFTLNLSRVPVNRNALLALGVSNSIYGPISLPFEMAPLVLPGCFLLVSLDFLISTSTLSLGANGGAAAVPFFIPGDPALVGLNVYAQWAVQQDPSAPTPLALTGGLKVTIQP